MRCLLLYPSLECPRESSCQLPLDPQATAASSNVQYTGTIRTLNSYSEYRQMLVHICRYKVNVCLSSRPNEDPPYRKLEFSAHNDKHKHCMDNQYQCHAYRISDGRTQHRRTSLSREYNQSQSDTNAVRYDQGTLTRRSHVQKKKISLEKPYNAKKTHGAKKDS